MARKSSARERILDAAESVVRQEGALHMTLDAVAAKAGLSKGGLIYHFASQNELLTAMIHRFTERVSARKTDIYASPREDAARDIVAHILLWSKMCKTNRQVASALMAAAMRAPALLKPAQSTYRKAMKIALASKANPLRMAILAMAADGIWIMELMGIQPFEPGELASIKSELVLLAREWCGVECSAPTQSAGRKNALARFCCCRKTDRKRIKHSSKKELS